LLEGVIARLVPMFTLAQRQGDAMFALATAAGDRRAPPSLSTARPDASTWVARSEECRSYKS